MHLNWFLSLVVFKILSIHLKSNNTWVLYLLHLWIIVSYILSRAMSHCLLMLQHPVILFVCLFIFTGAKRRYMRFSDGGTTELDAFLWFLSNEIVATSYLFNYYYCLFISTDSKRTYMRFSDRGIPEFYAVLCFLRSECDRARSTHACLLWSRHCRIYKFLWFLRNEGTASRDYFVVLFTGSKRTYIIFNY